MFIYICKLYSSNISLKCNDWLIGCLLRLVCLLDGRYIFIMISDPQQNVGIHFLMKHVLQQFLFVCFTKAAINLLFQHLILSFSSDFFTNKLDFSLFWPLYFLPSTSCLYNIFPLVFGWSVLAVSCAFLDVARAGYCAYKPCNVPHASRITTSGTIFTEI